MSSAAIIMHTVEEVLFHMRARRQRLREEAAQQQLLPDAPEGGQQLALPAGPPATLGPQPALQPGEALGDASSGGEAPGSVTLTSIALVPAADPDNPFSTPARAPAGPRPPTPPSALSYKTLTDTERIDMLEANEFNNANTLDEMN